MKSRRRRRAEEFGLLRNDSDSDDDEPVSLERYLAMNIASGLTRGGDEDGPGVASDYVQAASELSHVVASCLKSKATDKAASAAVYQDALLAARRVASLDTSAEIAAAGRLQRAARLAFPQAKYKTFESEYKKAAMAQKKRMKKQKVFEVATTRETDSDYLLDDEHHPVNIEALPEDVLKLVLERLGPHDLARASCVNRTWRECAKEGAAWRVACLKTFGEQRCEATVTRQLRRMVRRGVWGVTGDDGGGGEEGTSSSSPSSSSALTTAGAVGAAVDVEVARGMKRINWRRVFQSARRRWPDIAAEPTGRVFCTTCRRLLWMSEAYRWSACGGGGGGDGGDRTTGSSRGGRCSSRSEEDGLGGGGNKWRHATVRFPAHRVVRYLRAGSGSASESDSGSSDSDSDSDSSGGGGGGRASGRHRLWRIPTLTS